MPFRTTGMDYAGPVLVQEKKIVKKVSIHLFTCAVVRAIHLEVVESLSTEDFLLPFRRFISSRLNTQEIVSHNGLAFTGHYFLLLKTTPLIMFCYADDLMVGLQTNKHNQLNDLKRFKNSINMIKSA